jgi:hypothetical protein
MAPSANREGEVQRFVLALALTVTATATMLCWGSVARAQAVYPAFAVCPPLPAWYPRGWELMLRQPCVTYVYGMSYYSPGYYSYPAAYPLQRVSSRAVHHRRPYLRPGWWW